MTLPDYEIRPICVGLFGGPYKPEVDPATVTPISAMYMFLILGGDHPVLVDTGTLGPDEARERQDRFLQQPPEMKPLAALAAHGVAAGDIKTVINTHVHWDHCSGNDLFADAVIYVQRADIGHAATPLDRHKVFFDKLPGVQPQWLQAWDRIHALDGDVDDLLPGISLVTLPGHTPGSQGVLVATPKGRFLIAGDTVNTYAEWFGDKVERHLAPSLLTSYTDWASSMARIERLGAEVIPSHDLKLQDHEPFGR